MALRLVDRFQAPGLRCFFGQGGIQVETLEAISQSRCKKIQRAEKERDEAKQEAKVAYLIVVAVGDAKARVEDDLSRARDALKTAEEEGRMLGAEVSCLSIERMTLLLELGASKDEVSFLHSQVDKDKEALEEDY